MTRHGCRTTSATYTVLISRIVSTRAEFDGGGVNVNVRMTAWCGCTCAASLCQSCFTVITFSLSIHLFVCYCALLFRPSPSISISRSLFALAPPLQRQPGKRGRVGIRLISVAESKPLFVVYILGEIFGGSFGSSHVNLRSSHCYHESEVP